MARDHKPHPLPSTVNLAAFIGKSTVPSLDDDELPNEPSQLRRILGITTEKKVL